MYLEICKIIPGCIEIAWFPIELAMSLYLDKSNTKLTGYSLMGLISFAKFLCVTLLVNNKTAKSTNFVLQLV